MKPPLPPPPHKHTHTNTTRALVSILNKHLKNIWIYLYIYNISICCRSKVDSLGSFHPYECVLEACYFIFFVLQQRLLEDEGCTLIGLRTDVGTHG